MLWGKRALKNESYIIVLLLLLLLLKVVVVLDQRRPTECGVAECDREASMMMRPWTTRGCCAVKEKKSIDGRIMLKLIFRRRI